MVATMERKPVSVRVRPASRQGSFNLRAPTDATIGEILQELPQRMHLPESDTEGRPVTYRLRLEREGRGLYPSETAGDVLQENDELVMQPYVVAG